MPLISHKARAQWRYTSKHLMWQWRALGKPYQLLVIFLISFVVYAIVNIYHGTQTRPVSVDTLFAKVNRPMCPIRSDDLETASRDLSNHVNNHVFSRDELIHSYAFNPQRDSLVMLHIQGTSGANFVRFVAAAVPTDTALWSQDSSVRNADSCARHMDYGTLQKCVEESDTNKRALVVTMLRDPVSRFMSEWQHVHSGEPWHVSRVHCTCAEEKCESAIAQNVPQCILGDAQFDSAFLIRERGLMYSARRMEGSRSQKEIEDIKATILLQRWKTQSLDDFIACPENPANNRQVRMLGNYDVINNNCAVINSITQLKIAEKLLESAKNNLKRLAFFGLVEYQRESQELFQKTFGLHQLGDAKLVQNKQNHASCVQLDDADLSAIKSANYVDSKLYEFAKDLFFQRLKAAGIN